MLSGILIGGWLESVETARIEKNGNEDVKKTADANMQIFSIEDAERAGVTVDDLSEFIRAAYIKYCEKTKVLKLEGWFYAWFDEMSATLRLSLCNIKNTNELPFSCAVAVTDNPGKIAEIALNSRYKSGIPYSEFIEAAAADMKDDPFQVVFNLDVFARKLM